MRSGKIGAAVAVAFACLAAAAVVWLLGGAGRRHLAGNEQAPAPAAVVEARPGPAVVQPAPPAPAPPDRPSGPSGAGEPAAEPVIAGSVLDASDRAPLAGARVASRPAGGGPVRGVETDAAGRFLFRGLPARRYEVVAAAEGYLVSPPAAIEAAPGAALEILLERGLEVRGRVVDEGGAPVTANARVSLEGAPADRFAGSFKPILTGAEGDFAVPGVPPGQGYRVVVRAAGFSETAVEVPEVRPPRGVEGLLVTLARYRILGKAVAESGPRPGAGVRIEVRSAAADLSGGGPDPETPGASTGPDGAFSVRVPRPAEYWIRALDEEAQAPWQRVSVPAAGPSPEVTLALERLRPIEGRVLDPEGRPAGGATVAIIRDPAMAASVPSADRRRVLLTGDDGRFRALFLAGLYHIRARRGAQSAAAEGVAPGDAPLEIVLKPIEGAVKASGRFLRPGGKPLLGTAVRFEALSGADEPFEARADHEGWLEVEAIAPGEYNISFPERAEHEIRAWVREVKVEAGTSLDLSFEERLPRGSVSGMLDGAPPGGFVNVIIRPVTIPADAFAFMAACGATPEGRFGFEAVPPGRYVVRADADEYHGEKAIEVEPGRETRLDLVMKGR